MNYRLICVMMLFLTAGCDSDQGADPGVNDMLITDQTIDVAGEQRSYHLYLPDTPSSAPVVILFHGNSGSSDQLLGLNGRIAPYKVWLDVAKRENVILVVPDGLSGSNGKQGWNDCRTDAPTNPTSNDVAFISELIDFIQTNHASSTSKVYAHGTSNGGHMVMRLAEEIPQELNAVAFIAASKPANSQCAESTLPLSALIMNGTGDPITPHEGGQIDSGRGEVLSVRGTITYWVNRNQTETTPVESDVADTNQNDASTVKRYSYQNGSNQTVVENYEVINGGHTEPSIDQRYSSIFRLIVGNQNGDLEMAETVWQFFQTN